MRTHSVSVVYANREGRLTIPCSLYVFHYALGIAFEGHDLAISVRSITAAT
jgi:hypothetical protein